MRNLTIKRTKSFVGCLMPVQVYIEDREAGTTTINDVPCTKLGTLKNGEEKTFSITEEETKIYVIADKLSKGFCNDYYRLGAGSVDVSVSGKNIYNPMIGNPFRFDGVTDAETLKTRNKNNKISIIIMVSALIVGAFIGGVIGVVNVLSSVLKTEPEEFSKAGLTITATDEFELTDIEGYDFCLDSRNVAVLGLKEKVDAGSAIEYAKLVVKANNFSADVETEDGLTYFEFDNKGSDGEDYHYIAFTYKASGGNYWLVQFAVREDKLEKYEDKVFEWAKTVEVE